MMEKKYREGSDNKEQKKLMIRFIIMSLLAAVASLALIFIFPYSNITEAEYYDQVINPFKVQTYSLQNGVLTGYLIKEDSKNYPTNNLDELYFQITFLQSDIYRFKFTDSNQTRFEVPCITIDLITIFKIDVLNDISSDSLRQIHSLEDAGMSLSLSPFYFTIFNTEDSEQQYLSTKSVLFSFTNESIEYKIKIFSEPLYQLGLGERIANLTLANGEYVLYTQEKTDFDFDDGDCEFGCNLNGVFPFYISAFDLTTYIGVMLLNANQINTTMTNSRDDTELMFQTNGGVLDLFIFIGSSPLELIHKYQSLVGFPIMPPYWSFGHNMVTTATSLELVQEQLENFYDNDLPISALWLNTTYKSEYTEFTLSDDFDGATKYFSTTYPSKYNLNISIVLNINPGQEKTVPEDLNGYIYDGRNEDFESDPSLLEGVITYDDSTISVIYPNFYDYTNSNWNSSLNSLNNLINFQGIWHDLNEVFTECDGYCDSPSTDSIELQSLPISAYHLVNVTKYYEQDLHSMYGLMMSRASHQYLSNSTNRTFLSSRSNFLGSGKYVNHHFLKINYSASTSSEVIYSFQQILPNIFNFQIFGIFQSSPLINFDAFDVDVDASTQCIIYQFAIFLPMLVTYNFEDFETTQMNCLLNCIYMKYSLLLYIYSEFYKIAVEGGLLIKPLFFDESAQILESFRSLALNSQMNQFMFGNKIMLGYFFDQLSLEVLFPNSNWFDFTSKINAFNKSTFNDSMTLTQERTSEDPMYKIYIKEGSIIPYSDYETYTLSSVDSIFFTHPIKLIMYLNELEGSNASTASGYLFKDNGIDSLSIDKYVYYNFSFSNYTLTFSDISNHSSLISKGNLYDVKFAGITLLYPISINSTGITATTILKEDSESISMTITYVNEVAYIVYKRSATYYLSQIDYIKIVPTSQN